MELIDASLEMGIGNTVNGLVIFVIFVFELILSLFVLLRYVKLQAAARSSSSLQISGRAFQTICPYPRCSCLCTSSGSQAAIGRNFNDRAFNPPREKKMAC